MDFQNRPTNTIEFGSDFEKTVAGCYTKGGSRPNGELQSKKQRGKLFVRSRPDF